MRKNFRRLCAALTGISMLMSGMCMPQYTATAYNEADYANYPVSYAPGMEPNVLLKTIEADLSQGDPVLTLSGEDLHGQAYDLIFAKVYYQPAEENDVPEGTERLATHAVLHLKTERTIPGGLSEEEMLAFADQINMTDEQEFCELRTENEYALTAVKKIGGFDPETDSLELKVSFAKVGDPETETAIETVNCGKCAVQFYGFNYEKLPDEAYLTELATTEYEIGFSSHQDYLELTDEDIRDKMYANYYVKAEYTVDSDGADSASQWPEYAGLCAEYCKTIYETVRMDDPPMQLIESRNEYSEYSCTDWVRKLDKNHYSVIFPLDCSEQSFGFDKRFFDRRQLDLKISCNWNNELDDRYQEALDAGKVKLTLYGYEPYDLPSPDDMVKVASVKGKLPDNVRLESVSEPLSLDSYLPDNYYLTCAVSKYRGAEPTVAGVAISVIRDLSSLSGEEKKENVEVNWVSVPVSLESGFGAVKIDPDQLPLQAGDKVEISVAVFDSEGNALSDAECNTVLYSYNEDGLDTMPDVSELTLLGEATTELSEETVAASVEIGYEQLYKTGFTDYYAVAEYSEPDALFSNDHSEDSGKTAQKPVTIKSFAFGTEQKIVLNEKIAKEAAEDPYSTVPPESIIKTVMSFSNREVKAVDNASFISLGRPEIGTGSIKVTAVGLTGDTQATSGNLTVKVYGYNRYEMPDYADMDELLLTGINDFDRFSITYDDAYQTLWIQTRHVAQILNDGETWDLKVTHADGSGTETPLEWNMINGTRIVRIDPAELGLSAGDTLTVERQDGDWVYPQALADMEFAAQIAIYGEKAADPALKLGDVDCSGVIDVADAVLLARFVVEDRTATITTQGRQNADTNRSGQADPDDIILILKYIAKLIREF